MPDIPSLSVNSAALKYGQKLNTCLWDIVYRNFSLVIIMVITFE